ncbi:MAG: SprB repeat-containing protein, partial [Bacteroidota bacterium]
IGIFALTRLLQFAPGQCHIISNLPPDITLECDEVYPPVTPTATDNCDNDVTLTWRELKQPGECEDAYTLTRYWTATDNCNNQSTRSQRIVVLDTREPTFDNAPDDVTIDLTSGAVIPPSPNVRASDNCDLMVEVTTNPEEIINGTGCSYTLVRSWEAEDNCGNIATTRQEITVIDEFSASISNNSPVCDGEVISISVSGGDSFEWSGPNGYSSTDAAIEITGANIFLHSGTYTVTVTSAAGCSTELSTVVDILRPSTALIASNGPVCRGNDLELYADGGVQYSWTGPDGWSSNLQFPVIEAVDLPAGTYTYTVTATNRDGCATDASIEVDILDSFIGEEDKELEVCIGGDINLTINGEAGWSYFWLGPTGFTSFEQSPTITNVQPIMAGTYTVTVRNEADCEARTNVIVTITDCTCLPPVVLEAQTNNATCGVNDGSSTILLEENLSDYSFVWTPDAGTPGVTENIRTDLPPGNYTIDILSKNNADCSEQVQIEIGVQPSTQLLEAEIQAATCDANNGVVRLSPNNYNYLWLHDNSTAAVRNDLAPGSYQVNVVNPAAPACPELIDIIIESETPLQAEVVVNSNADCDVANGSAMVNVLAGGTGAYTYGWSDGGSGAVRNDLAAGDYTVTLSDGGNACDTVMSFSIINESFSVSAINDSPVCLGERVNLVASDGGDSYQWTGPNAFNSNEQNPTLDNITNLMLGTYTVRVVKDGCVATATTEVSLAANLVISRTVDQFPDCGVANGQVTIEVSGGSGNYSYVWSDDATATSATRSGLSAGAYALTVTDVGSGCEQPFEFVLNNATFNMTAGNEGPVCVGDAAQLTASAGADSYQWSGPDGFSSTEQNPVIDNSMLTSAGTYQLIATKDDCTVNVSTVLEVVACMCTTPDVSLATTDANCGLDDGTATVSTNSGAASFNYTWSDDAGINSATRTGLTADDYSVTISVTAGDCDTIINFTILDYAPGASLSMDDTFYTDCAGDNDATVVYNLTTDANFSGTPVIEIRDEDGVLYNNGSLSAGSYCLTVLDDKGCEAAQHCFEIIDRPLIDDADVSHQTCTGLGSIDLLITGGTGIYTFNWGDMAGTDNPEDRTGLVAGLYSVTITDSNGCETSREDIVLINECGCDEPEIENIEATPDACNSGTGTITIDLVGDETDYIYNWSPDVSNSNVAIDLAAGSYSVTIADPDNNTCLLTEVIEVTALDLQADVSIDQQPDCGQNNGAVTITVVGGSGDYSYSWNGGASRSDLGAGTYSVDIEDNNNVCSTTVTFTLTDEVAGVSISAPDEIMTNCSGVNDANLVYTITEEPGFEGPASIGIKDASGNSYTNGTLAPGSYCLVVLDVKGCVAGEHCFEVLQPDPIAVSVNTNQQTCDGPGSINLTVNGGTPFADDSYTYEWGDLTGTGQPKDRTGLNAGIYSVVVTDANGCTRLVEGISISNDCCEEPVVNNIITVDASCGNDDGSATIQLANDPSGYLFSWSPNVSSSNTASGLAMGTYNVTISSPDDATCNTIEIFQIGSTNGPEATVASSTPANCSAADGSAFLTPASYQYTWSDGGTGHNRTDLLAETYTVTVTDPNTACSDIILVVIEEQNDFKALPVINQLPDCNVSNGSVTMLIEGGSGDYTADWGPNLTRTDFAAGSYRFDFTDNVTGCKTTATFSLAENVSGATLTIDSTEPVGCVGEENGRVNYTLNTDATFSGPAIEEIVDENGVVYTNGLLPFGKYCVRISDINGCVAAEECFELTEPTAISASVEVEDADCEDGGSITLSLNGGAGNYTFNWSDLATGNDPQNRTNLSAGIYSVTISDDNNCFTVIDGLSIGDDCIDECDNMEITDVEVEQASCGESNGSLTITMVQAADQYSWTWSPGVSNSNSASDLASGVYMVTITDINDATCIINEVYFVSNAGWPQASVASNSAASCDSEDGAVTLSPAEFTYRWSDGTEAASRDDLAAGDYEVTITDPNTGCTNLINFTVAQAECVECPNMEITDVEVEQASCGESNG